MLSFQDAKWAAKMDEFMKAKGVSEADKIKTLLKIEPDFHNRCAIRSIFDGRYRFSRYFSPLDFNTPKTFDALVAKNDLELYDLDKDPEEINNLAMDTEKNRDLIMSLNEKMNRRLDEEVGVDDGSFLPLRNGKWYFPPASERG
jgi:arylsulfatase A-like enzyme